MRFFIFCLSNLEMAYVPPHLRKGGAGAGLRQSLPRQPNTRAELRISSDSHAIRTDGGKIHVVPEANLRELDVAISNSQDGSYTYCFLLTLHARSWGGAQSKAWPSLIHQGYAEFDRCPGLWLNQDSKHLIFR